MERENSCARAGAGQGRLATKGNSASREGHAGGPDARLALVLDVPPLDPEPPGPGGHWVEMVALSELA